MGGTPRLPEKEQRFMPAPKCRIATGTATILHRDNAMALLWQSLTYAPYVIQMDGISIQEAMPMIVLTLPRFTNS